MSSFIDFFKSIIFIDNDEIGYLEDIIVSSVDFFENKTKMIINVSGYDPIPESVVHSLENKIKNCLELDSANISLILKERPQVSKEIEIRTDEYLLPNPILESAVPIFGKKISHYPVSINSVERAKNVVVWGKVFDVSILSNRFDSFCNVKITD